MEKKEKLNIMRKIILKLLILIIAAIGADKVYADVQADLIFTTAVPQAASIQRKSLGSAVKASPETGIIQGDLSSVFELSANDTDEGYDFIITASVETTSGTVQAYDNSGNIVFGNTETLPTFGAVVEAMNKNSDSYNAISYPVTVLTTSPFTSSFQADYKTYGNCYVIKINGGTSGTVTHKVGPSPVAGTFSKTKDTTGTYQATVTMTAAGI